MLGWVNADESVTTQIDPIRQYITARQHDELMDWDVHISSLQQGEPDDVLEWPIVPIKRKIGAYDLERGFMSIGGAKMRVSSRGVERLGVPENKALEAEASARNDRRRLHGRRRHGADHRLRPRRTIGGATPPCRRRARHLA